MGVPSKYPITRTVPCNHCGTMGDQVVATRLDVRRPYYCKAECRSAVWHETHKTPKNGATKGMKDVDVKPVRVRSTYKPRGPARPDPSIQVSGKTKRDVEYFMALRKAAGLKPKPDTEV